MVNANDILDTEEATKSTLCFHFLLFPLVIQLLLHHHAYKSFLVRLILLLIEMADHTVKGPTPVFSDAFHVHLLICIQDHTALVSILIPVQDVDQEVDIYQQEDVGVGLHILPMVTQAINVTFVTNQDM